MTQMMIGAIRIIGGSQCNGTQDHDGSSCASATCEIYLGLLIGLACHDLNCAFISDLRESEGLGMNLKYDAMRLYLHHRIKEATRTL